VAPLRHTGLYDVLTADADPPTAAWIGAAVRRPVRAAADRHHRCTATGRPEMETPGSILDKTVVLSHRPAALRRIRAWLTPAALLQRYWQVWSNAHPPPRLQDLLIAVGIGQAVGLHLPPYNPLLERRRAVGGAEAGGPS
jgi:hypothetical protein